MVKSVVALELKGGYWSYIAITDDVKVKLRAKATRYYRYAFQFDKAVGPGKGMAGYFLYSNKPGGNFSHLGVSPLHRFEVIKGDGVNPE